MSFTTEVIEFDGKPRVLDIEARVRGDKIERMTAWYDGIAEFVNLKCLSEKTQFEIEQQVWKIADEKLRRRSDLLFEVGAEGNREYVKWINRGSR